MHKIRISDPDNVSEIIIAGPFNCAISGNLATLTFTHERPIVDKLMSTPPEVSIEAIVRARLVMPVDGLRQLCDSIEQVLRNRQAEGLARGSFGNH